MDPESYALLLRVFRHCENVCIIMVVDNDNKSVPIMPVLAKTQKHKPRENEKTFSLCEPN